MNAATQTVRILTAEELSPEINIPAPVIRRLHRQGKIPVVDLGRRTKRYILADVMAALAKQTRREVL